MTLRRILQTSLRTRDSTHRLGKGGPGRRAAFRGAKAGLEPQVLESSLLARGQLSALRADGSTDVLRWEDEKIQLLMMIAAQLWGPLLAPGAVLHTDSTESPRRRSQCLNHNHHGPVCLVLSVLIIHLPEEARGHPGRLTHRRLSWYLCCALRL